MPFDRIVSEVAEGGAPAGLLIHEGQLTYRDHGLHKLLDLGEWWLLETGLPLPLGLNAIRRDLGLETIRTVSAVLHDSIDDALANRDEALAYALGYGRGLDDERADRFVGMYVNELTQDLGAEGREAVRELLRRAEAAGAYDVPVRVEFLAA
jgi:1,4-dihydroxy-6-naphthoate synthase